MQLTSGRSPFAVEIQRSARRRRTISAKLVGQTLVLQVPAGMTPDQEAAWADKMRRRLEAKVRSHHMNIEGRLDARARVLNQRYFGGELIWRHIEFVPNQNSQYGSCSSDGYIRLTERLLDMPEWVLDYVIMHELAHLKVRGHNEAFWALVNRYPLTERARGFLIARDLEEPKTV